MGNEEVVAAVEEVAAGVSSQSFWDVICHSVLGTRFVCLYSSVSLFLCLGFVYFTICMYYIYCILESGHQSATLRQTSSLTPNQEASTYYVLLNPCACVTPPKDDPVLASELAS